MEAEISETLFGWHVDKGDELLVGFALTEAERLISIETLCRFFQQGGHLQNILEKTCVSKCEPLSKKSFYRILNTCNSLVSSTGPVGALLQQDVEEISLSLGRTRVFKRDVGWLETGLVVSSESFLLHVVNKLAAHSGRRISRDEPVLNAFLVDGTRIHAVSQPLSPNLTVSIRKFRDIPFTLSELAESNVLSSEAELFLEEQAASSFIVAGNTGSGKTTTLNALLSLLPPSDRFVFVEDVSELTLPSHSHKARLLAHNIPLSQLIYESLRMRPDRLVVSEIRSREEVKAFANALLSGSGKSCYSTFHAASAKETLRRLIILGFRKADLDSLGFIIVQRRFDNENGKEVRRITEVASVKNGKPAVLFKYNKKTDKLETVHQKA